jgi:hypothetical protein
MKRSISILSAMLLISLGFGQGSETGVSMGPLTTLTDNNETIAGHVKAIHYTTWHITEEDGKMVKGQAFTDEEAVDQLWQPWSYFYNENGKLYQIKFSSEKNPWIGVLHYDNDKISDFYWLHGDTLKGHQEIVYLENGNIERHWENVIRDMEGGKVVYVLDENGEISEKVNLNRDGEIMYKFVYDRDKEGKILSRTDIDNEGKTNIYTTGKNYRMKCWVG